MSKRICLISHNAGGALLDGKSGHIGGVERQTAMLARWLRDAGHLVSVVVWSDTRGQADEDIDGIRIIRICGRDDGIRGVRFFWPRWTSLWGALRRADADIYVQNVAEVATGQVGIYARIFSHRFVLCVASEPACRRNLPNLSRIHEKVFYSIGLRAAHTIIAQTRAQEKLLANEWKLPSLVVPMPCMRPSNINQDNWIGREGKVIWVGRVVPVKRLEIFLDVARLCADVIFQVVGEIGKASAYEQQLRQRISTLENIEYLGRKSFSQVWEVYAGASLLICTSEYEGFPNTFLEAMSFGIPIISTFDPDGVLMREGLGKKVESPADIVAATRELLGDGRKYSEMSTRGRRYFDLYHNGDSALPRMEKAIIHGFPNPGAPLLSIE